MKIKTPIWIYPLVITGMVLMLASSCKKKEEIIVSEQPVNNWISLGGESNALRPNGPIFTTCTDGSGNVYAAGAFTSASNKFYVAKWDGTVWSALGTGINELNAIWYISTICTDAAGNVYAAGYFPNSDNYCYVAKWDGTKWSELGSGSNRLNANKPIYSICTDSSGNVYAAGAFTYPSGPYMFNEYVAKWNGTSWSEMGTGSNAFNFGGSHGPIYTICTDRGGNVYAAGSFSDSTFQHYVAKWDGTSWKKLGSGNNALNPNYYIWSVCTDGSGNVYANRGFVNPTFLEFYIAKWNGTNWDDLGKGNDGSIFNNIIGTLCTDASGNVYAAGVFSNAIRKYYVAKWDGTGWSELGGTNNGLNAKDEINSICTDAAGNVYAAGAFTNATGCYVAKYPFDKH